MERSGWGSVRGALPRRLRIGRRDTGRGIRGQGHWQKRQGVGTLEPFVQNAGHTVDAHGRAAVPPGRRQRRPRAQGLQQTKTVGGAEG